MDLSGLIQIILGSIFVLVIPGFAWTFIFFDRDEIDGIERITLSFGLSMVLVPLVIFYSGYLGIKITLFNLSMAILCLTLIPFILYSERIFIKKGRFRQLLDLIRKSI